MKLSRTAAFVAVSLLLAGVTGAAPAAAQNRVVVPIVLDVTSGESRFTTELSLANTGDSAVTVSLRFVASLGEALGSGTVSETIPAGGQLRYGDAIATLRSKGLEIPATGSQGGTLVVDSPGSAVVATARTATAIASPAGRAGLDLAEASALRRPEAAGAVSGPNAGSGSPSAKSNGSSRSHVSVRPS